ncbi:MAG: SEC-C metal-binding domain-containing protein, partial [bacterium]
GLKKHKRQDELMEEIMGHIEEAYEAHEIGQGEENMRLLERLVILRVVDSKWMRHLDAMDFLRDGIGLRGYEQTDPLVAYSKESAAMWSELMAEIQEEIGHSILRLRLITAEEQNQQQAARAKQVSANRSDEEAAALKGGTRVAHANIGRNDPCYCGSGKKYKQCCLNK